MNSLVNEFTNFEKKIKILYWDSNHVPNIDVGSATTPTAGITQLFFYNINTVFKYSTKKKDLNPKMKMGTNSFGVHLVKPKKSLTK